MLLQLYIYLSLNTRAFYQLQQMEWQVSYSLLSGNNFMTPYSSFGEFIQVDHGLTKIKMDMRSQHKLG